MIVDLKVHVQIVHYKGRQGSNMRPPKNFCSEFAKVYLSGCQILTSDPRER